MVQHSKLCVEVKVSL